MVDVLICLDYIFLAVGRLPSMLCWRL
uniref:Uncharacterized protein n=1 Tax=Rhizophora mucronata TaxID=61149 RepID=A0A2P2P2T3_RHIMU